MDKTEENFNVLTTIWLKIKNVFVLLVRKFMKNVLLREILKIIINNIPHIYASYIRLIYTLPKDLQIFSTISNKPSVYYRKSIGARMPQIIYLKLSAW